MPYASKTPCRQTGCATLVSKPGYCDVHKKARDAAYREERQARNDPIDRLYATQWWRKRSQAQLRAHPLCADCSTAEHPVMATRADHFLPVRQQPDPSAAFFGGQLASLCNHCHEIKSAREGSRFGGRSKPKDDA